MKSLIAVLLAASASVFATGATAAFNYNGYYLVSFNYPGGSFQHCIGLTETQQDQGYTDSGTWVDTDFPDTAGTWVLTDRVFQLAGYVDGSSAFLTVDAKVAGHDTLKSGTFDYFDSSGNYYAAGTATAASDSSCDAGSVRKPGNGRSFLN